MSTPAQNTTPTKPRVITRGEFDQLNAADQSAFCLRGGTITGDSAAANTTAADESRKPMKRAEFEALSPREKSDFCRAGGTLVD